MTGSLKKGLLAVFAAAAMVLVIACFTAPDTYAAEGEMIKAEPVTSTQTAGSFKTSAVPTTLWKISVAKNGYVAIHPQSTGTYEYSYQVKVLKSNKKSLFSGYESLSPSKNNTTYVGLLKGTYYVRVRTNTPSYVLYYTLHKPGVSSRGTSQSSAKKLSKGHTKKGIVYTNNYKKQYYYKLINPKTQRVTLKMKFLLSSGNSGYSALRIKFFQKGHSKNVQRTTVSSLSKSGTIKLYTLGQNNKLKKGTYYIVVYGYKHGSGYYTLKW
ncbi:MAG: hypothetical protein ACOYJJ_06125 [Anaerovoracaceae bacterium]|jgi:hypothetical protein